MTVTHKQNRSKAETEEWAGHDTLLSPAELRKNSQQSHWRQELDQLGKHWVGKAPGMEYLNRMQCAQAQSWTLMGIYDLCCDSIAMNYAPDELIAHMMDLLEKDIQNYNPIKSSLGQRMDTQIKRRLSDALRGQNPARDRDEYSLQLRQLEAELRDGLISRSTWVEQVVRVVFRFHYRRVDSVANTTEKRQALKDAFREILLTFEPGTQNLEHLCRCWVNENLGSEKTEHTTVSMDIPLGEGEEDGTLADVIPDVQHDFSVAMEQEECSIILLALIASFHSRIGKGSYAVRNRYAALNYTEQLACFAQTLPLPKKYDQSLRKPMNGDYFRYFMNVPANKELDLPTIQHAEIRSTVGEGVFQVIHPKWNDQGFLPANVQKGFLHTQGIRATDTAVSEQRAPYCELFLNDLRKRR